MKKRSLYRFVLIAGLLMMLGATAAAAPINATLGKPVTLNGLFGVLRAGTSWDPTQPLGTAGAINDGIFASEGTLWNQGSIWWDAAVRGSEANSIVIDLQGAFHISGIITQADNNDNYQVEYLDMVTNAWTIDGFWGPIGGWGLMTRPNADQVTPWPVSFDTTMIRLTAFGGDDYFAYSEFQAWGDPIPEPGTFILLGAGLAGLLALRRRS
jgi:hypothetical protein